MRALSGTPSDLLRSADEQRANKRRRAALGRKLTLPTLYDAGDYTVTRAEYYRLQKRRG